uniref:Pleckstrin homology-like domain family A member 1 n=1 Tax=Buteo japonicus TaxID=224669 RepID=A0A8C0ATN5_9AVES
LRARRSLQSRGVAEKTDTAFLGLESRPGGVSFPTGGGRLRTFPLPAEPAAKVKELHFSNMKTVDCVERKGKYVYFTVVMAEGKEIDFRCAQEQGWNAAITLQMVQYKNRQAILAVRSTRQKQQHLAQPHEAARQPEPQLAAAAAAAALPPSVPTSISNRLFMNLGKDPLV